ncbi:MAG: M28 family peptidase [Balneolaceae bacterium]|nr:MAG: M28 family peptidase [Balneolaceae bacterium]
MYHLKRAVNHCAAMFLAVLLLQSCDLSPEKKEPITFLQEHVEWLADDERGGRLAGSFQEASSANYIADYFQRTGLLPYVDSETYLQQFVLNGPMVQAMGKENHISRNVVGIVEGTVNPDRFIVVGAHYDGQGMGGIISMDLNNEPAIHNSADDNASGTAGLMWLANRFANNPAESTIIFAAFSGEEMGLLGSEYFVEQMDMPVDSVLAMINLDMIGRLDDGQLSIFGTGTGNIWDSLLDEVQTDSLVISQVPDGMSSSDHASFSRAGIPVLHYFTNSHDDYHRPSDTSDKINYTGMKWVLDHAEQVIRMVDAIHPDDIIFTASSAQSGSPAVLDGVTLGVVPDYNFNGTGFRIDHVRSGSLAEESGFTDGDIIVRINSENIANIFSYMETLNTFSEGDSAEFSILRDEEEIVLSIKF